MNRWKTFWAVGTAVTFGFSFWKNRRVYPGRKRLWLAGKSLIDTALTLVLAVRLPALLCGYVLLWLTRPLKGQPVLRTTLAAGLGFLVSLLSGVGMEGIVLLGVFAVDAVTGGVLRYWNDIGAGRLDWKRELGVCRGHT